MNLFILFVVLNVANVIIQTIKSLATVKCGKTVASLVNAFAYGLYTVVLVYMNCDLELWQKVVVVALANLVGVYVVKLIEERLQKEKMWKIEVNVKNRFRDQLHQELTLMGISHNYIDVGQNTIFNCYCATRKESQFIKEICERSHAKYFVTEAKTSLL